MAEEKSLFLVASDVSKDEIRSVNDSCDNFDALSDEILIRILKFLDVTSLCRCSQVNRRFNSVTKDPFLYTNLNLYPYRRWVNDEVLNSLVPRCRYLRCLDLTNCGHDQSITAKVFKNFLHDCGSLLTDLTLHWTDFVDDSVVIEILSICRNLKNLGLCSNRITNDGYRYLTRSESLESLTIFGPKIEQSTLCSIIRKNRKMRHLNLIHLNYSDIDDVAMVIADSCPNLESLEWTNTSITPAGIRSLARCIQLRQIDISSCNNIFNNVGGPVLQRPLQTLFSSCVLLEDVKLAGVTYFIDEDLEPLLSCPIKALNLSEAKYLTAEMCSRFFLSWPKLKYLNLKMCKKIKETDVQKWREMYPHVSIEYEPYRSRLMICTR